MALEWWQMPGPATLIQQVLDDLESGQCVVVGLPEYAPAEFRQALAKAADLARISRDWYSLPTPPLQGQPWLTWLWEQWHGTEGESCPPHLTTAQLLAKSFDRAGGIWELPGVTGCTPAEWLKFLQDYQQALQQVSRLHRNVLLLVVEDTFGLKQLPRRNQPQLAFHRYQHQLTQLDMLLFLSRVAPAADSAVERELHIHTVAALFPTDADCALTLLQEMPLAPDQMTEFLETQQRERNWCVASKFLDSQSDDAWAQGLESYMDGKPIRHICVPGTASLRACMRQAQWLAQVRVLLPWIEQQRWILLHNPELRHYLQSQLPYEWPIDDKRTVMISEPDQLELTHMLYLLRQQHKPREGSTSYLRSTRLHRKLETLRECRNEISHLSPLSEAQIISLLAVEE